MLGLDVVAGPDIGEEVAWRLELPKPRHERLSDDAQDRERDDYGVRHLRASSAGEATAAAASAG